MNARLQPRTDVGVPRPTQIIQGPSLSIIQGEIVDIPAADANPASRTLSLLIEYRRTDGTPIEGKAISIDSEGVSWAFIPDDQATTNAGGQVSILLTRLFLDAEADTTPTDFIISARIGLISNNTTVTF
jgi:hypothetical protein